MRARLAHTFPISPWRSFPSPSIQDVGTHAARARLRHSDFLLPQFLECNPSRQHSRQQALSLRHDSHVACRSSAHYRPPQNPATVPNMILPLPLCVVPKRADAPKSRFECGSSNSCCLRYRVHLRMEHFSIGQHATGILSDTLLRNVPPAT